MSFFSELFANHDIWPNEFMRILAIVGFFALIYWCIKWPFKAFLHVRFLKRCYYPSVRFEKQYKLTQKRLNEAKKHWDKTDLLLRNKIIILLGQDIEDLQFQAENLANVELTQPFGFSFVKASNTLVLFQDLNFQYLDLKNRLSQASLLKQVG